MATRTVTVHLKAKVGDYLAGMKTSEKAAKELRQETDRLNKAGWSMTKGGGITAALVGLPGIAGAAAASVAAIPAFAFSASASLATLAVATNGVGTAMAAVASGDSKKLAESMKDLTESARNFVREYGKVKPMLDTLGNNTQQAFFAQLSGDLEQLATAYIPSLLRQMPRLASTTGQVGSEFVTWASTPVTVAKVNRQFDLAVDLTGQLGRLLRSGTSLLLDLADAGRGFASGAVRGLADGTEALERWVANARATGQMNDLLENGSRILERLGQIAAEAGDILFDVFANPALADGADALLDVLGLSLDVVRALLTAFSALPSGVQSAVVTLVVFGAAALAVTGRVVALKASLDQMKLSAIQAGGALKSTGAFLAGPWGVALGIATALLAVFAASNAEAEAAADALRGTLDKQTGAFTDATREQVINQAAANNTIKIAKELGLNLDELTTALLGGSEATQQYYDKQLALAGGVKNADGNWSGFRTRIQEVADAVDVAKVKQGDFSNAMGTTTGKVHKQISALQKLAGELRAQSDPVFALIKAQKDMASAQTAYTKAVEKHGPKSKEAEAAALTLAQQSIELADATATAGATFDGKLTPAMEAALRAAGLTTEQIDIIKKSMQDAKRAGDAFAKNYTANVEAKTTEAQAAVQALIVKVLQLKDKSIRIDASVYWTSSGDLHVGTGTQLRRWGGIDYHMARGGTIQAHHTTAPTVMYGERATGGEAFIPRNGDRDRSLSILSTAAGWYGMQIAGRGGGGGGGTTTIVHEHVHRVEISGTGVVEGLRKVIELKGGDVQNALGARRR